jgi:ubiquinone/menaquinone biosynthesis C-methylase UbiE
MEPKPAIDYNTASRSYDNTRSASDRVIDLFHQTVVFSDNTTVLDFGCGTGNYLDSIARTYGCKCHGAEPSAGMRDKAKAKNPSLIVENGDHRRIPFGDELFDFSYMTDVIHHVPDLRVMFLGLNRVLKRHGWLCIVTESHEQIERRFYNRYFPTLAEKEKRRYPEVNYIKDSAEGVGLTFLGTYLDAPQTTATVSAALIKTVEERNYSMFRLLDRCEYSVGLEKMKSDIDAVYDNNGAGQSLIWFRKI